METRVIIDEETLKRSITRIAYEIIEQIKALDDVILVGIKTRGITLAKRIADRIQALDGLTIPVGELDITYYRDDRQKDPTLTKPLLPYSVVGKQIIIVDDVLYTGRTIRAALDAIIDMGRPKRISLAVLVDRGHRELPIRPDFVGKNIPTSKEENIKVELRENDGVDAVTLIKN